MIVVLMPVHVQCQIKYDAQDCVMDWQVLQVINDHYHNQLVRGVV